MADLLTLEILTPQNRVLSTETPWVTLPGSEGELGILPQHVPLVTAMGSGVLAYEEAGQRKQAAIHYGYVQVSADRVTLLSQMVEPAEEIDLERARKAEQNAREQLRTAPTCGKDENGAQIEKIEHKLKRALVRQKAAG